MRRVKTTFILGIFILFMVNFSMAQEAQDYFNKATSLLFQAKTRDDFKRAANLYEKAKELSPQWAEVYYNLGIIYEEIGYYSQAIENFNQYSAIVNDQSEKEKGKQLAEMAKAKYEKLEEIKRLAAKWRILDTSCSNKYKFDFRNNTIWKESNAKEYLENSDWSDRSQLVKLYHKISSRIASKQPYVPLVFDGNVFIAMDFGVILLEDVNHGKFFVIVQNIYRGEINIDNKTIIIDRFVLHRKERFSNYDEAINEALMILKDYTFLQDDALLNYINSYADRKYPPQKLEPRCHYIYKVED
ncbi:MAG: tetratricopeptide repeat protein [Caldimicrobium sp.]